MGSSTHLRATDVAAVYRLVGECRELGVDARVWQQHLNSEMRRTLGCHMVGTVETVPTPLGMKSDWTTLLDFGWTDSERRVAAELLTGGAFPPDQFCRRLSQTFCRDRPLELTRQRQELLGDSEWFRSDTYEIYRLTGASDIVMSLLQIPERDRALCLGVTRGLGQRAMSGRETRIIGLLGRLIQPYLGRGLALSGEPGIAELSPRRQQVLAGLLEGLAEKQIARRLKLSVPTVHEYAMAIYRHFGVSSRGELMALFLRRGSMGRPASGWKGFRLDNDFCFRITARGESSDAGAVSRQGRPTL